MKSIPLISIQSHFEIVIFGKDDVKTQVCNSCQKLKTSVEQRGVLYSKEHEYTLLLSDLVNGDAEISSLPSSIVSGEKLSNSLPKHLQALDYNVISFALILDSSCVENVMDDHVPVITYERCKSQVFEIRVNFEVIFPISGSLPTFDLICESSKRFTNQINLAQECIIRFYDEMNKLFNVNVMNFISTGEKHICVEGFGDNVEHMENLILTIPFPVGLTESEAANYRRELHLKYGLPLDKGPIFHKNNRLTLNGMSTTVPSYLPDGLLVNVHLGLKKPSGVGKDGKIISVQGFYAYHHYLQDDFDDDKWGCAYRSAQTLISWFRLQGYTNKLIPSHYEMQKILFNIGDKPEAFVGSNQWIGSTEVGFILENYLTVKSKILHVSSGAEMGSIAQELAEHFESCGTPVMIGGGVLAHTILGVTVVSDCPSETKFLVLDPHYTGLEDLNVIQSKGWVGWKPVSFWNSDCYYNLCLPQRPLNIV